MLKHTATMIAASVKLRQQAAELRRHSGVVIQSMLRGALAISTAKKGVATVTIQSMLMAASARRGYWPDRLAAKIQDEVQKAVVIIQVNLAAVGAVSYC